MHWDHGAYVADLRERSKRSDAEMPDTSGMEGRSFLTGHAYYDPKSGCWLQTTVVFADGTKCENWISKDPDPLPGLGAGLRFSENINTIKEGLF